MRNEPKPLQVYKHFKGNYYQIVEVAKHSETGERLVIYRPLFEGADVYARPLEMFLSEVDHEKYPDVTQKYRFEKIGDVNKKFTSWENDIEGSALKNEGDKDTKTVRQDNEAKYDGGEPADEQNNTTAKNENAICSKSQARLNRFLDAPTSRDRLLILESLRKNLDEYIIEGIAAALDINVGNGSIDDKYEQIEYCLETKIKYEGTRR